jgi:16S rRNA (guanine527-N7)-methyltransferase
MSPDQEPSSQDAGHLNSLLAAAGLKPISEATAWKFSAYLALIQRWNTRMNLTAIRDAEGILKRHFVESIACAQFLPREIGSLLDFGSGAGFPGIPIALFRPEIVVTLAESQAKKAAFLQEAVRTLGLNSRVFSRRAEDMDQLFDCITLRAVDRMDRAVIAASNMVRIGGWLAVLTTIQELPKVQSVAGGDLQWLDPRPLHGSEQRVLGIASKGVSAR